jgi:HD superfamily phosphohydrolase
MNKKKVINDPVWGFVTIPSDLLFEIIQHPTFQRLRRIKQLGLTEFVYPGAIHTRFHHAIGAMHLMTEALSALRSKNIEITDEEVQAAQVAILLHDIGHGPFSHTLEYDLFVHTKHEDISSIIMEQLNQEMNGALDLAIKIFNNQYHKTFLHQLVSSQLDMDRMDYLSRDSFFTGVSEGTVGADRLIKMLTVVDNQLVIEEKGIYSIENFLTARRVMYWQVYLHKTTVSAETMLIGIIRRAKYLAQNQKLDFCPTALMPFFIHNIQLNKNKIDDNALQSFLALDDTDIWYSIKQWCHSSDRILSELCSMLMKRKLFKLEISSDSFDIQYINSIKERIANELAIKNPDDLSYFFYQGELSNAAYVAEKSSIKIKMKDDSIKNVEDASDLPTIHAISKIVKKQYISYPKSIYL